MHKKSSGTISPRRLCVAVAEEKTASVINVANQMKTLADVIEIRLDAMRPPEVAPIIAAVQHPLLFTNRPTWEGGAFAGEEEERVASLLEALNASANLVDIELKTQPDLFAQVLEAAKKNRGQVIVSWHDFKGTPSSQALVTIFQQQYRSGAHIGKIVTMANSFTDVLRILELQALAAEMEFPLIAFCMGRAGMISRIATLELGGYMTYAAPDSGRTTAPGQLTISSLRTIMEQFDRAS